MTNNIPPISAAVLDNDTFNCSCGCLPKKTTHDPTNVATTLKRQTTTISPTDLLGSNLKK